MRRLCICASTCGYTAVSVHAGAVGQMDGLQASQMSAASSSLHLQCATIRNLHQYPKARYKSLVKDRRRFARNWYLSAGNNYELVEDKGHEREATENFAIYAKDSDNDRYILYTDNLKNLPAKERLTALVEVMKKRWKVNDNNRGYDKAKLLLEALECFSEMRQLEQISLFDELPMEDQNTFLQYVQGCSMYAHRCSHSHPNAVAILLRATQICDEMGCIDKRDEMLRMTETCNENMGRAYAFSRLGEGVRLPKVSLGDNEEHVRKKCERQLLDRYADRPDILEGKKRIEYQPMHQFKRTYLNEFHQDDPLKKMLNAPARPEFDSWSKLPS